MKYQVRRNINNILFLYSLPAYNEEWKPVTYPRIVRGKYLVSSWGRIYNCHKKKIVNTRLDKDCHERVNLSSVTKDNIKTSRGYFVHRIVAWEFIGPPPDDMHNVISHKNEIPMCNYYHNLEWATVLENTNHAKEYGRMNNTGIHAKVCKYDEKLIRKICSLFEQGYKNVQIFEIIAGRKDYKSKECNKIYQLINKLGKRVTYWDIVQEYNYNPPESYFQSTSNQQIEKVRNMIKDGKTNYDIMNEFGYTIKNNPRFYNRIIEERARCRILFNDYRKTSNEK